MAALTEADFARAEARGRDALTTEPRARDAAYDPATGRVSVNLLNGCTYIFPVGLVQDLANATPDELGVVQVDGQGFNLHWPVLNVDLYVPGLVAGVFGTVDWTKRALARAGGRATSEAKAAAARANGAKGGRPRKG